MSVSAILLLAILVLWWISLLAMIVRPVCDPERSAGCRRSRELLRELLPRSQHRQLQKQGYLDVPSSLVPDRTYRIPAGNGRIELFEGGCCVAKLCVLSVEPLPEGDVVLSRKLLLEADERRLLETARWFDLQGHPFRQPFYDQARLTPKQIQGMEELSQLLLELYPQLNEPSRQQS